MCIHSAGRVDGRLIRATLLRDTRHTLSTNQPSKWGEIVVFETPGVHCRSPDAGELRYEARDLENTIRSDFAGSRIDPLSSEYGTHKTVKA